MDMTDAEYAEALTLARASLAHGGQRTFLARALLRADAAVLAEREACAKVAEDHDHVATADVIRARGQV